MAKYVIEDTTLTGIADAIRGKTGSTDPIPVTDMAAQIAAITGGGSSETLTTIFEEQTVEGFALDEGTGGYFYRIESVAFVPAVGETLVVKWDGVSYTCTVQDVSAIGEGAVGAGNLTAFGGTGNNEPFVVGWINNGMTSFAFDDATSHTVGIYQAASGGTSGGGSVEGIVYVTFMNGDVELCKTACMKGDSTVDPVEDGKIAVPTKAPSTSTVYTYAGGWALTDGGEADVAALVDVTEDRTVYAVYNESAREYTINFYDDDGTTLLESLQVAYGTVPRPSVPEREYDTFDCWEPEIVAVTGDADYVAVWGGDPNAILDDWATIISACNGGTYASKYAVGMYKSLDLGDQGVVNMRIAAMKADTKSSGGTAPITWIADSPLATEVAFYSSSGTSVKWSASALRTYLTETMFPLLPTELQNGIKSVNKTHEHVHYYMGQHTETETVVDTLWVPSEEEMASDGIYSGIFPDDTSRIRGESSWLLRTGIWASTSGSTCYVRTIGKSGALGYASRTVACGVVLCFCT